MADLKPSSVAVVELVLESPGLSDAERFEFPDERSARAFAREVMGFALDPTRGRRRQRPDEAPDRVGATAENA